MEERNQTNPTIEKLMNVLNLSLIKAMWVVSISEKHAIWIGNQLNDKPTLFKKGRKNLKKIIEWKKKNPGVNLRDYEYVEALKAAKDNGKTTFLKDQGSLENENIVAICNGSEYKWVALLSTEDCIEEGNYMSHCLRDSSRSYLVDGAKLFSLRNAYNKPVLTLQIKNGMIPEYRAPHDADPEQKYAKYFAVLEKTALKKQRIKVSPLSKYDHRIITKLKKSQRTHKGNLCLDGDEFNLENGLPDNLHITGDLLIYSDNVELPRNLKIDGDLTIGDSTDISYIPNGTRIGGDLEINGCIDLDINLKKIKIGGKILLRN